MSWLRTSRFKPSGVAGFPTWWGGTMFGMVGGALFYSMTGRAPVEQWIALLMIIIILIQLVELSLPFRAVELAVLPFVAPFANETFPYVFEISNSKEVATEQLYFRLSPVAEWTPVSALAPHGRTRLTLKSSGLTAGRQSLPTVRMKTRSRSELFQLWRRVRFEDDFLVLPAAVHHGLSISRSAPEVGTAELSHLESIKDERLMFKMDQKIFLKTGKPYYRVMEEIQVEEKISLDWSRLSSLSQMARGEQFSRWLKDARAQIQPAQIHIESPFYKFNGPLKGVDWLKLHEAYAVWFYAQA